MCRDVLTFSQHMSRLQSHDMPGVDAEHRRSGLVGPAQWRTRVAVLAANNPSAAAGVAEERRNSSAVLVVKRGPNAGSRFLLDQAITSAGRHPDSDIFLDDVTVSRRHAEFRLESNEFHVVDVGSLNGTYVNREPVDSAVLANGDEVQIGKFRLVFLTGPKQGDDDGGS